MCSDKLQEIKNIDSIFFLKQGSQWKLTGEKTPIISKLSVNMAPSGYCKINILSL